MLKHSRDVALLSGLVYFLQGALGLSALSLLNYLRDHLKWSVADITAIASVSAIPWIFKLFYGLFSDVMPVFGFRRKTYLVFASLIAVSGWLGLFFLPVNKTLILVYLLLTNCGFAATDVITDAYVVEHSNKFTSSIYQSIAWGSRSLGAIISGIGGWLSDRWAPQQVFFLTMCLPLMVTFLALWIREKKVERSPFSTAVAPVKKCLEVVFKTNLGWFACLLITVSASGSFNTPFIIHLKENLGFSRTVLGGLSSALWGGFLFGSILYYGWFRHHPIKGTLYWAVLINSIGIFSVLLIRDQATAFILIFLGGVLGCFTMVPIMSSAATLAHRTGIEGTLFAILMSIYNAGQIFFGFVGGQLSDTIGLKLLIIGTGFVAMAGLLFITRLKLSETPVRRRGK